MRGRSAVHACLVLEQDVLPCKPFLQSLPRKTGTFVVLKMRYFRLIAASSLDLVGARNFASSTIFWSELAANSEAKAIHRSRRNLQWKVSLRSIRCLRCTVYLAKRVLMLCSAIFFYTCKASIIINVLCVPRYGFIIAVTTIDNIGVGHIQPGRGFVVYPVKYKVNGISKPIETSYYLVF